MTRHIITLALALTLLSANAQTSNPMNDSKLTTRQINLATCAALEAKGDMERLDKALRKALDEGVTVNELKEAFSQLYAYTGFPRSLNAADACYGDWPKGNPNTQYARYFKGDSHLAPIAPKNLSADDKTIQGYSNVTFEPGCRNNWHIHHGAHQILICVSGKGWYQEWGKPAIPLKAGDIIDIPEGVKHWHGAQADSWFQHLATHVKTSGEERNEWLEPVSDKEYNKLK